MASNFLYSSRDHKFIIKEWLEGEKILGLDRFKDYLSMDDVDMILDQALKVCRDVVAPTNEEGDRIGAVYKEGKVFVPSSFHHAYKFIQENGWGSSNKDVDGEGTLPNIIYGAVHEYTIAANPSMDGYIGLNSGVSAVIQAYGSKEQVELFTPNMFRGVWAGTMCLTEPGGGSDVGDLLTKAYPTDDPSIYKIKGTKCFITSGDHDLTENIIHLVLARIDGAAGGTKGLSLFIVPKLWVNADGSLGEMNDVSTIGIEHKMGLKGSATAVLGFGEESNCRGLLLGEAQDANGLGQGISQMFKIINESRINTGQSALAVATVAYNNAVKYALERLQGRLFSNPGAGRVPIIQHEDVRRMLLTQKAVLEGMRAMIFKGHYYVDQIEFGQVDSEVRAAKRRIEIVTPLIKAYCSDQAWNLIAEAIQVYGGYGYTEEYPVAHQARDSKIYSIWEGTNFIQALDLVGRKWQLDNGKMFREWFAELEQFIYENKHNNDFSREFEILAQAAQAYQELLEVMTAYTSNPSFVPMYSTRVLRVTAELYAGCLLMQQALVAKGKLVESKSDQTFYTGKIYSAKFYVSNIVPDVIATVQVIKEGDSSVIDIPEEAF